MATVEAPCAPADSGSQPSTCGVKTAKTVAPNDVHILLVDDERLSRVVVGNLLRKCSYKGEQCCTAANFGSLEHHSYLYFRLFKTMLQPGLVHFVPPVCRAVLLIAKCAVTEAGSGMEALEILRGQPPGTFSLVLTV